MTSTSRSNNAGKSSKPRASVAQQPGPGTYENVLAINSAGSYPATYVPNTLTRRIVETKLPVAVNANPGPGTYRLPSDFGIYVSSRYLKEVRSPSKKL